MSDVAVHVQDLGKRYSLGQREPYGALRDILAQWLRAPLPRRRSAPSTFWSLRHVSFDVREGEVLGIVGRNGAGKSTLLKILSRITEPTEGAADLYGRVGSLLEVGTGFHPELTGRENIFLNGAILGMQRGEIRHKFDEIVAFAEVEAFLDMSVKHYSSGMYLRLAFSVAAHLDPEILLVDEVLAVGDAAFQKKCLGKMNEVSRAGRTVLFVSHNMGAITRLCSRALYVDHGELMALGPAADVVHTYLSEQLGSTAERSWPNGIANPGVTEFELLSVRAQYARQGDSAAVSKVMPLTVEIRYRLRDRVPFCRVGIQLSTADGVVVVESYDSDKDTQRVARQAGEYQAVCEVSTTLLRSGQYMVSINAGMPGLKNFAFLEHVLSITLENTSQLGPFEDIARDGILQIPFSWTTKSLDVTRLA